MAVREILMLAAPILVVSLLLSQAEAPSADAIAQAARDLAADDFKVREKAIILNFATSQKMVVISQDNDFGTLIFHEKLPFYGVVHLRPGHMEVEKTVETISVLFSE